MELSVRSAAVYLYWQEEGLRRRNLVQARLILRGLLCENLLSLHIEFRNH